jgi:spore coat polysaccharide biosynthesis protein SpsF
METVAIIQARLGSTRFPRKVLADLFGRSVLQWVVDQVRAARGVHRIVVATCTRGGEEVRAECRRIGVECWISTREEDVLGRFVEVAERFGAGLVVRVCGDNPLLVPSGIDRLLAAIGPADYAGYEVGGKAAILRPTGYFAEVATAGALRRLDAMLPPGHPWREHVTQGLYEQPGAFRCVLVPTPAWYDGLGHAAVDVPEDLEHVRRIALGLDALAAG